MSDWSFVALLVCSGVAFLVGRWRGIKDFEAEMVQKGLLPPENPDA